MPLHCGVTPGEKVSPGGLPDSAGHMGTALQEVWAQWLMPTETHLYVGQCDG